MDLNKLRYFYIVAKLENMSLASKELLISQPALSKAISTLETDLEMELFYRNGKRISLNDNGRFLYERAEMIFANFDNLERSLKERRVEGSGELSIVTTLPYTFTNILDSFLDVYPNVKFSQVPLSQENLTQFIEFGKYDVCITTEKIEHSNVEWIPLFEEEIFLTVPYDYPEAQLDTVDLTTLRELPFIGLTPQYSFRKFTNSFCKEQGYEPVYQVEVEEATTILQLVKNGRGAAFTPETSFDLYENKIKHLKIVNGDFKRTIGLLQHVNMYQTKVVEDFIEHCKQYFNK